MNVAVKPWRCHLSAGSPGWDAERGLCSTWMHGRVLSAGLLTQALLHFNLSSSTETWSSPQPQTHYLYKSQLQFTLPLKVTATLLFCTYTVTFNRKRSELFWTILLYFSPIGYVKSPVKFDNPWHKTNLTSVHPHLLWGDWWDSGKPQTSLRSSGRFTGGAFLWFTKSKTPTKIFDVVSKLWVTLAVRCGIHVV